MGFVAARKPVAPGWPLWHNKIADAYPIFAFSRPVIADLSTSWVLAARAWDVKLPKFPSGASPDLDRGRFVAHGENAEPRKARAARCRGSGAFGPGGGGGLGAERIAGRNQPPCPWADAFPYHHRSCEEWAESIQEWTRGPCGLARATVLARGLAVPGSLHADAGLPALKAPRTKKTDGTHHPLKPILSRRSSWSANWR